jgi:hypothetical protein
MEPWKLSLFTFVVVFWILRPCSPVDGCEGFRGTDRLRIQFGGCRFHRVVAKHVLGCTLSLYRTTAYIFSIKNVKSHVICVSFFKGNSFNYMLFWCHFMQFYIIILIQRNYFKTRPQESALLGFFLWQHLWPYVGVGPCTYPLPLLRPTWAS